MTWAVRAGRLFDGQDVLQGQTVLIEGTRIVDVGPGVAGGLPVLDLGDDVTLMPGLVDAHVHLAFDASADVPASFEVDDEALLARMRTAADRTLAAGVTTVRDLGDRGFLSVELGREIAAGRTPGPTVLASGPPLTTVGGHCHFLGGEVADRDAMLRAVAARAENGCDVVKVMVSGGNITPGNLPWDTQFSVEDVTAIVAEAHRLGLSTAGHVHAAQSVVDALDAGFDTLEHVTFMTPDSVDADPAVLRRIADSGTVVSATVGALPGMDPPPAIAARLSRVLANMQALHGMGGRIVVGTDAGVGPPKPHGVTPWAHPVLVDAGLTALDALRALTSDGAAAIGLAGTKGVLARGADADLLAVRGDPTRDPTALTQVVGVWARGTRVHSAQP